MGSLRAMAEHLMTRLDAHIPFWVGYDKFQEKHFKSPQATENFFEAMYGEDISDKYIERFVSVFTKIREFVQTNLPSKIDSMETDDFPSEIVHLVICTEKSTNSVCLRYILVRPVAEGMGLFKMVLYYLAVLCKHHKCNLAVRKPLPKTQSLMKSITNKWIKSNEPGAERKHSRKLFWRLKSSDIDLSSFGDMQTRMTLTSDGTCQVLAVTLPSSTQMNDLYSVSNRLANKRAGTMVSFKFIRFQMRLDAGDMNIVCHRLVEPNGLFILIDGVRYLADIEHLKEQETFNEMCWACKINGDKAHFKTISDGAVIVEGIEFEARKCDKFIEFEASTAGNEGGNAELLDINSMMRSNIPSEVSDVDFIGKKFEFLDLTFETLVDFINKMSRINSAITNTTKPDVKETQLTFKIEETVYTVRDNMEMTIDGGGVFQLTNVINFQYWFFGQFNKRDILGLYKTQDVFKTVWPRIARYSETDMDDVDILTADRRTPIYRFSPKLKEPVSFDISMYYNPVTFNLFIRVIGKDRASSKRYSPINLRKLRVHKQEPYSFYWDLRDMNNISLVTRKGKRISPNVCAISEKFEFENNVEFNLYAKQSFFYDIALTVARKEYVLIYIDTNGIEYLPNLISFQSLETCLHEESSQFSAKSISVEYRSDQVVFVSGPITYTIQDDLRWYTGDKVSGKLYTASDLKSFLLHCLQIQPTGEFRLHGRRCDELW